MGEADLTLSDRIAHGGDLAEADTLFPDAPKPWIDLSTGINPVPYPDLDVPPQGWARLPGRRELERLTLAAAAAYGAPSPDHVVVAPGSQILISLLPHLRRPGHVVVLSPTYGEHAVAWRAAGHRVDAVSTIAVAGEPDVLVVTSPNNPDGALPDPAFLAMVSERMSGRDGLVLIDEAFMDAVPEGTSLAGAVDRPGLVVLRSFGKFHGLAGLRLGFALARPDMARSIARALGPWAVSGPALAIGARALADSTWRDATRERLVRDSRRLDALLMSLGLEVVGGTPLFRLVASDRAGAWFERLGRAGIFVRRFADRPRLLRFGLPRPEDWHRLAAVSSAFGDG